MIELFEWMILLHLLGLLIVFFVGEREVCLIEWCMCVCVVFCQEIINCPKVSKSHILGGIKYIGILLLGK